MSFRGLSRPLFFGNDCIVSLTFINYFMREFKMLMLTIEGLKTALLYVAENGRQITYFERGPKSGLFTLPESMSEDMQYHLRVVQLFEPKLTTRLSENYTVLSLDGQELYDILNDTQYLDSLHQQLRTQGYTSPSDRQIFRLLRERMSGVRESSWTDVISQLLSSRQHFVSFEPVTGDEAVVVRDNPAEPEGDEPDDDPEAAVDSLAGSVIKNAKKARKHVHPAAIA